MGTKSWGHRSSASGISANEIDQAMLDAEQLRECPSNGDPLAEKDEDSVKAIEGRPKVEQTEPLQADPCPQSKSAEVQLSSEANGIELTAPGQADPSKGLPCFNSASGALLPSIETGLEHDQPTAEADVAGINREDRIVTAITTTHTLGNFPQAELPRPETAVVETVQSPNDGLSRTSAYSEQAQVSRKIESVERTPQRYRPPPQRAPRQTATRPENQELRRTAPSEVALEIRVRLTFDRFGFCTIGLLPERTAGLDNEVAVKIGGVPVLLIGQEDWYQDLHVETTIGDYLQQGIELRGNLTDGRRARWLLSGRDLYVLASHQRASGFVSTNRLSLGRSDIVLCRVDLLHEVEAILNVAGCEGYSKLDESHGVPLGWVGLRSVMPKNAIALNLGSDPFYAIKPAPDIEIELEGGVRLRNSVWLAGYPPRIKLFGESSAAVRVLVDGKEGQTTGEGFVIADGYDISGQHSVHCEGLSCSCSYSIEEPPDSWEEWPAYHFAQADICGPLVQLTPEIRNGRLFTGPMSNPLLLGAEPGQVFWCSPRRVALWKGFVPFDVVWALPAQPLRCDKKTTRILQFANVPVAIVNDGRKSSLMWSNAILDASRKGLRIENGDPDSTARWKDYKKVARNVWRAAR